MALADATTTTSKSSRVEAGLAAGRAEGGSPAIKVLTTAPPLSVEIYQLNKAPQNGQ